MKIQIEVEIKPFYVPDCVALLPPVGEKAAGIMEARTVSLKDLDTKTLSRLCEDFTREVFNAADKQRPADVG